VSSRARTDWDTSLPGRISRILITTRTFGVVVRTQAAAVYDAPLVVLPTVLGTSLRRARPVLVARMRAAAVPGFLAAPGWMRKRRGLAVPLARQPSRPLSKPLLRTRFGDPAASAGWLKNTADGATTTSAVTAE
jgi:hypothetical protein